GESAYGFHHPHVTGEASSSNKNMSSTPALYSNSRHLFFDRTIPAFSSNRKSAPSTGLSEASSTTTTGAPGVCLRMAATVLATCSGRFLVVTPTPMSGVDSPEGTY